MRTQPMLQIRTTPAVLHIDADLGQLSLRQPKADVQLNTRPAELTVKSYPAKLNVDQSKAFAAYTGGSLSDVNSRIYSGIQQIFLQNIANRVQQGNQIAEYYKSGSNTIANIIGSDWQGTTFPEVRGPASYDNVDIRFDVRKPDIRFTPAVSELNVIVNKPEIEYQRGKLDIYMKQYGSIEYIPPAIDVGM